MERLLTTNDVAERLARSARWVREQAREGAIPSFKLGKAVRFRESEIEAWLDKQGRGERLPVRRLHAIGGNR